MNRIKIYYLVLLVSMGTLSLSAQNTDTLKYIQYSGKVVTEGIDGKITPLGYTNVSIKGTTRGTATALDGFFSIVAKEKDVIVFSRIGYKSVEYIIPDTLSHDLYYWIQIMSQDSILLPEAVIRPFPSKEHFKIEFLALDISNELENQYSEYLAEALLDEMREVLPSDGAESVDLYLREAARSYRYSGQIKPQNIFNPFAWKQFIEAWKRGDYKRKKKKS